MAGGDRRYGGIGNPALAVPGSGPPARMRNWGPFAGHPQTIKGRHAPKTPRNLPPQTRSDWVPPIPSWFQACDPASAVRVPCDGASAATSTETGGLYASTAWRGRPTAPIHFEAGDPASLVKWRGRPRFKTPMKLFKQCTVEADRGFNNHFEAGDPASVVEWRGRPRFKNQG